MSDKGHNGPLGKVPNQEQDQRSLLKETPLALSGAGLSKPSFIPPAFLLKFVYILLIE